MFLVEVSIGSLHQEGVLSLDEVVMACPLIAIAASMPIVCAMPQH